MKTKSIFCALAASMLAFSIYSCTGPEGEEGPIGPAGPQGVAGVNGAPGQNGSQGPQGPQGQQGQQGPQGQPGTANVIFSAWTDVVYSLNWITPQVSAGWDREFSIQAPKLTQEILDRGDIVVYMKIEDPVANFLNGDVRKLAATFHLGEDVETYNYSLRNGQIKLLQWSKEGSRAWSARYRYVLIPGGTSARKQHVNWENYNEVKAMFNLRD